MASPINFGDLAKAVEICVWIKKHCFDPSSHANLRYAEFKKDIIDLERRLHQFKETFETALEHTQDADSSKREAEGLIGDFKLTLQQCQEFLQRYVKFDQGRSNILENASWHSSAQLKVNELQDRIQSHIYMIGLIIEPIHLQISSKTLDNTKYIIQLLTQPQNFVQNTPLPDIPPRVDARLRDASKRGSVFESSDTTQIPLKEGINAASLQYRRSTAQSANLEGPQTVEQYLNLLKAQWLLKTIAISQEFDRLRPGHLYRRLLTQLEQGIAKQHARYDIPPWSEDNLCALNDSDFAIWPEKIQQQPKDAGSTEPGETALAELALVPELTTQKEALFIFKSDNTTLRIVHSSTPFDQSLRPKDTVRYVDLRSGGLVPLYFISSSEQKWNFQIIYERTILAYELQSRKDALNLQLAFTGYESVAYSGGVSFTVTYRQSGWKFSALMRDGQQTEIGEIQLWQWPSEGSSQEISFSPRTSQSDSGKHSLRSGSGYSFASQSFIDLDPNIISVVQDDNGREMVISQLPPPPLLMAFTNDHGVYTIWQTDREYSRWGIEGGTFANFLRSVRARFCRLPRDGMFYNSPP
jgi:hypothetical protein